MSWQWHHVGITSIYIIDSFSRILLCLCGHYWSIVPIIISIWALSLPFRVLSSSGAVVQLKTITSAVSADESLSTFAVDKTRLLQQILVYVVSIMCCFIDLDSSVYEKVQLCSNSICFVSSDGASSIDCSGNSKVPSDETRLQWHQKAVVSVMEAGGLNWLVGKVGKFRHFTRDWGLVIDSKRHLNVQVYCIDCCRLCKHDYGWRFQHSPDAFLAFPYSSQFTDILPSFELIFVNMMSPIFFLPYFHPLAEFDTMLVVIFLGCSHYFISLLMLLMNYQTSYTLSHIVHRYLKNSDSYYDS